MSTARPDALKARNTNRKELSSWDHSLSSRPPTRPPAVQCRQLRRALRADQRADDDQVRNASASCACTRPDLASAASLLTALRENRSQPSYAQQPSRAESR